MPRGALRQSFGTQRNMARSFEELQVSVGGTQTTGGLQKTGREPNHGGPCRRGNKEGARAKFMCWSPYVVS